MYQDIPLINDLLQFDSIENVEKYINDKYDGVLLTYKYFNNITNYKNITNKDIYNYIKFIDISGINVNEYYKVINYINNDNFKYFEDLFDNDYLKENLLLILNYGAFIEYYNYKEYSSKWVDKNMDFIKENFYNLEETRFLDKYIIFENVHKYYKINNIIFNSLRKDDYSDDFYEAINVNNLEIVKYLCDGYKFTKYKYDNSFILICIKNNNIEIFEYLIERVNKYKCIFINTAAEFGRVDIFKSLMVKGALFSLNEYNKLESKGGNDEILQFAKYFA